MNARSIVRVVGGTLLVLSTPILFTLLGSEGWNWSLFDFVFVGVFLLGAGFLYELVARRSTSVAYRGAVGLAVVTALALIWVNGTVGIIGGDNPANALYLVVVAFGAVGATMANLQPRGMMRTLIAMAVAAMLIPVIALLFWSNDFTPSVLGVFVLNALFASAFVIAALLFRRASA